MPPTSRGFGGDGRSDFIYHAKQTIMEGEKTIGEQRVRTDFNPAQNDLVSQIKQKTAELINLCEELKPKDGRLASLAQTTYEEAGMWAVKAATA